jgi:aminoglycoside 3-N-acetyltransferase
VAGEATPGLPPGAPVSRDQLAADLRSLGLRRGQDLLINCSLRRIGPVEGGAAALLDALLDVAGPLATLVVPSQTTLNSLTSRDFHAAVAGLNEDERARFVAAMPGFDPAQTPSHGMGAFAEYLRRRPSAVRSRHPQASFAALGPRARACTSVHDLDCHLGDRSPLGWLYAADAAVLLLGVGYTACTAFHLAEYRLPWMPPVQVYHCFTAEEGRRVEREFTAVALDDSDFARLGAALEASSPAALRQRRVGSGIGRVVPLRTAVDFSVSWLAIHRRRLCPERPVIIVHIRRLRLSWSQYRWGGEGAAGRLWLQRCFSVPEIARRHAVNWSINTFRLVRWLVRERARSAATESGRGGAV